MANWRALDACSGPGVETAAVLKADAYGLGAARVGPALARAGAASFFVALAEEGADLRALLGPGPAIHVLSGLLPGDAVPCREHDLIPCLNSAAQVSDFENYLSGHACAIQLDTGMKRLGMERDELAHLAPRIAALAPKLVLSHLACADTPAHPMNEAQLAAFALRDPVLGRIRASLAATGGILLGAAYHHDMTRPGIGLFGGAPFDSARPVVTLSLPVIQVRDVNPGESVGYGAAWTADRPSRIATVAAGYGDGLLRALGDGGIHLYHGDVACPVVGRISMDLVTVDVSALARVPNALEILNARQTIDDLARAAGTVGYEILTGLGARYERVYKEPARSEDAA